MTANEKMKAKNMSENLKDILSNLNPDIDQETLLLYLQGKLSAEQQHELEKQMVDSDFDSDALEGLHNFKDNEDLSSLVSQLNIGLKKKRKEKKFKEKLRIKLDPWVVAAVILILLIAVIGFVLFKSIKALRKILNMEHGI